MNGVDYLPKREAKSYSRDVGVDTTISKDTQKNPTSKKEASFRRRCSEDTISNTPTAVHLERSSRERIWNKNDEYLSSSTEPRCREEAEMRGFKAFLIIIKAFDVVFMVSVVLVAYIIDSVAIYPFTVFCMLEIVALAVAIVHSRRPTLGVMLTYVSLEIVKALAAMTLALVTVLYDRDKDCAVNECRIFNFTAVERFRFFWFLLSKAALGMFLCLVVMAHSPQLRDYNYEDSTMPLNI
ncbi:hypothetical protein GCK32_003151 [Trichostrongylus colubriformis]|uniref:Uncharacterized protein n=1 Tax=Trichostrongylus colubriformis TaxID=6319 RepID=A0AAN8FMP9_TRICO